MTILQIFNRYQKPGGEEASVLRVADTLGKHHKVVRCYFDSGDWAGREGLLEYLRQALFMVRNPDALQRVRDAIREHQPDLILLHNLFPVCSAAVFWHVVRSGIPVVQYIHNFRPYSVNGYCWADNKLCESGLRKNFLPEILVGSWQDSELRTAWYALIIWVLHLTGCYRRIRHWIAISAFMKEKFVEAGVPPNRITVLRHSWDAGPEPASYGNAAESGMPYLLFLGRLSKEKGVDTLIDAWKILQSKGLWGRLIIAGEGPLEYMVEHGAETVSSIDFVGHVSGEEKLLLLRGARAIVVPSRWWEPLGIVVYEAYDHGKPVLVAASGGLTETVIDGKTGLVHEPGNAEQLAEHMAFILADPTRAEAMGRAGRKHLLETTRPGIWLNTIESVLWEVAGDHRTEESHSRGADGSEESQSPKVSRSEGQAKDATFSDIQTCDAETLRQSTIHDPRSTISPGTSSPLPLITAHGSLGTSSTSHADGEKSAVRSGARPTVSSPITNLQSPISISVYLADQNPGHDRSFGISRMSRVVLEALQATGQVEIEAVVSRSSQQAPDGVGAVIRLPWGTRARMVRLFTDHFHPWFHQGSIRPDLYYFPKGYLPLIVRQCRPAVVTIHDTIIQYDEDHYPAWRPRWEYAYWSMLLRHTLRHADHILTVSEASKQQIERFMERHGLPAKEIVVTYEPCHYESIPQPEPNGKENYVIHLASREPHKRTAHLVRWWHEAEQNGCKLPMLHLVGTVPEEVELLLTSSKSIAKRPFLDEEALQAAYLRARALILPSEIEGFGLPALEAYYLGTPVCYVRDTSVEEVLSVATSKGGFTLDDPESLFSALEEVMQMTAAEVRACGLKLRETYAAEKVAERMLSVFSIVKNW